MKCKKCGSGRLQAINKTKKRGFFNILMNIVITILTGGIWLIILLIKGRKEQTKFVCMDCGKEQ